MHGKVDRKVLSLFGNMNVCCNNISSTETIFRDHTSGIGLHCLSET